MELDHDAGGEDSGTRLVDATYQIGGPYESGKVILPELLDCKKSSDTSQPILRQIVLRVVPP